MSPADDLAAAAEDFPDSFRLLILDSVESTNDEIHQRARAGAGSGLVIAAERQTAGRGRRGAAWFSPPGESLAFSVLLRPQAPKALWPRLALAAGLAVARAIETTGPQAGIKWPNDVWLRGRKVAGILVEAGADYAVVGIGLNVLTAEFPAGIAEIATSLRIETGAAPSRPALLAAVVRGLAGTTGAIDHGFAAVVAGVGERCVLTGKELTLLCADGRKTGTGAGIAPGGELLLRTAGGLERIVQADEVRIVDR